MLVRADQTENEKDSEFRPKLEIKAASDHEEAEEEALDELSLEDINLNSIQKGIRKEDRSSTSPIKPRRAGTKKFGTSMKETTKNHTQTDTLPVVEMDMEKVLNSSSKSFSLSKSIINHKDFVDLKGPISSEIFLSIKHSDILEDYSIGRLLGEGSYGQVKLVLHRRTNMERAMKVVLKSGVTAEEKANIMKEVSILKSLDHPNIIKVFDIYEDEKKIYLITE